MPTRLGHLIAPLFLAGIFACVSFLPAVASAGEIDGDAQCAVNARPHWTAGKHEQLHQFYVTSPDDHAAVGVWKTRRDVRIVVRVGPGEYSQGESLYLRPGIDLRLTRCETPNQK